MTPEEATKFLLSFVPCAHVNADGAPSDNWLKCWDCGQQIHRDALTDAGEDAARFQRALDVLTAPVVRLEWTNPSELRLDMVVGTVRTTLLYVNPMTWTVYPRTGLAMRADARRAAEEAIAAHVATLNLPCSLPPMPEQQ